MRQFTNDGLKIRMERVQKQFEKLEPGPVSEQHHVQVLLGRGQIHLGQNSLVGTRYSVKKVGKF